MGSTYLNNFLLHWLCTLLLYSLNVIIVLYKFVLLMAYGNMNNNTRTTKNKTAVNYKFIIVYQIIIFFFFLTTLL